MIFVLTLKSFLKKTTNLIHLVLIINQGFIFKTEIKKMAFS